MISGPVARVLDDARFALTMVGPRLPLLRSYHALDETGQRVWRTVRRAVPAHRRFLFEGCIPVPGQLWYFERRLLFNAVRRFRPAMVFEVGTWWGGGSTFFIAQALYENGGGVLHTIELDPEMHAAAVEKYRRHLPHLLPHVHFHQGSSLGVYPSILRQSERVDCLFLDGLGAAVTSAEYDLFAPYLLPGSVLMAHDWFDEKMSQLRPRIEGSPEWVVEEVLPISVSRGLALARKRSPASSAG